MNGFLKSCSKLVFVVLLTCVFFLNNSIASNFKSEQNKQVKNVIIMIADGFGPAGATLARYSKGSNLVLDSILKGTIQTKSSDSLITDSAAGATAYSTGCKTYNGAIAVDPKSKQKLKTIMEAAKEHHKSIGIVVKDLLPGATPGAFSAHVPSRRMNAEIARQQVDAGFDLLFGGGRKYFIPRTSGGKRKDDLDLESVAKNRGIAVIHNKEQMYNLSSGPVLGLFADDKLNYAIDNQNPKTENTQPSLKRMTSKALEILIQNENGFILMVEGSRIDHAAHQNDPAAYAKEILSYDETVKVVKDFVDNNPDTLMISVADHETGGVTIGADVDGSVSYKYHPEVLNKVKYSAEYLSSLLSKGNSVEKLLTLAGLDFLDSKQKNQIISSSEPINEMLEVINEQSRTGWTTQGHSAIDINLYAYGANSDKFVGNFDNTEIVKKIASLTGLELG